MRHSNKPLRFCFALLGLLLLAFPATGSARPWDWPHHRRPYRPFYGPLFVPLHEEGDFPPPPVVVIRHRPPARPVYVYREVVQAPPREVVVQAPPATAPETAGSSITIRSVYILSGKTVTLTDERFVSSDEDASAIWVKDGGNLLLRDATVRTTGATSSSDASRDFGLNAAVLASTQGRIEIRKGDLSTAGSGANALFAAEQGSFVTAEEVRIRTSGDGGRGGAAGAGGALTLAHSSIRTTGTRAAALAADKGGGMVSATDCDLETQGEDSPLLFSRGTLTGNGLRGEAARSEAVVIAGRNAVTLTDCELTGGRNGVMLHRDASGDADDAGGTLSLTGGRFATENGALFYVTNGAGHVHLEGVRLRAGSGVLARAGADRWGSQGANGGHLFLDARKEDLAGDLLADERSGIDAKLLDHSTLTGRVVNASLSLDATSRWKVTGDSSLAALAFTARNVEDGLRNIRSNGHTVTYDPSLAANAWLGGESHRLPGGGVLQPR